MTAAELKCRRATSLSGRAARAAQPAGVPLGRALPEELAQFRAWFLEFDWAAWDRQIEVDVRAGRLDAFAEQALHDHATGKTKFL